MIFRGHKTLFYIIRQFLFNLLLSLQSKKDNFASQTHIANFLIAVITCIINIMRKNYFFCLWQTEFKKYNYHSQTFNQ